MKSGDMPAHLRTQAANLCAAAAHLEKDDPEAAAFLLRRTFTHLTQARKMLQAITNLSELNQP